MRACRRAPHLGEGERRLVPIVGTAMLFAVSITLAACNDARTGPGSDVQSDIDSAAHGDVDDGDSGDPDDGHGPDRDVALDPSPVDIDTESDDDTIDDHGDGNDSGDDLSDCGVTVELLGFEELTVGVVSTVSVIPSWSCEPQPAVTQMALRHCAAFRSGNVRLPFYSPDPEFDLTPGGVRVLPIADGDWSCSLEIAAGENRDRELPIVVSVAPAAGGEVRCQFPDSIDWTNSLVEDDPTWKYLGFRCAVFHDGAMRAHADFTFSLFDRTPRRDGTYLMWLDSATSLDESDAEMLFNPASDDGPAATSRGFSSVGRISDEIIATPRETGAPSVRSGYFRIGR